MSRSRRKTPICGVTTAGSCKYDKIRSSRRFRRVSKEALHHGGDLPTEPRKVTNPWTFAKDGWQLFDPAKHPKLMRK